MAMQERAVRTKQLLIVSAAEIFTHDGFASSSLAEISSRAGVSGGALHFHFKNKQVLGEAVESAALHMLHEIMKSTSVDGPSPLQIVIDASHLLAQRVADDVILRAGMRLSSDATWKGRVELWREWRSWVQTILIDAGEQGNLASDIELSDAVCAITATVAGLEMLGRIDGDTDTQWCSRDTITRFWYLILPRLASEAAKPALVAEGPQAGDRLAV
ncbi:ScbR family autoregulator-binding transcription factor [Streptomyces sp. NBC_01520]|uniref:ScbR family autoregulator-binding transcription factor n=2 Tax=unclassified Streptomyces TaxID=2593676 RepID=UPI003868EED4